MASDIKFNLYTAFAEIGPWTKNNINSIDISDSGHQSFLVSGLDTDTQYFIRIVGGKEIDNIFVPYFTQVIGTESNGATIDLSSSSIEFPIEILTTSGIEV